MGQIDNMDIHFPLGGVFRKMGYQNQEPYTTPDCLNVRDLDVFQERLRGGSRPGLAQVIPPRAAAGDDEDTPIPPADFWPSKDTWLYFVNPGTPQDPVNASPTLVCGGKYSGATNVGRAIIHFDLTAVPPGATVTDAYLTLYRTASNNGSLATAMKVRRILTADVGWVETQASVDVRATATAWSVANATGSAATQTGPYTKTDPVEVDWNCPIINGSFVISGMTAMVQDALTSRSEQLHIMLMADDETVAGQLCFLASSEHGNDSRWPKLTVTYTV